MPRRERGAMADMRRLSVVLSFRNEADVIPELVRRLRTALGGELARGALAGWELIFVNDASTDASEALLHEAARGHDDIRVLTMSRPFGVAPCVMAGLEHARGDLVVYMDADLQDPPEVIPAMLDALDARPGIDVVHTVRTAREGEAWGKLFITGIGYRILVSLAAFAFVGYLGVATLAGRAAPPWWWAIALSLFLGGLQLLSLGILGLYLNAVFLESKGRPPYIVSRTFGFENVRPPR